MGETVYYLGLASKQFGVGKLEAISGAGPALSSQLWKLVDGHHDIPLDALLLSPQQGGQGDGAWSADTFTLPPLHLASWAGCPGDRWFPLSGSLWPPPPV